MSEYASGINNPIRLKTEQAVIADGEVLFDLDDFEADSYVERERQERDAAILEERLERKDAYAELGGAYVEPTLEQKKAIVSAGLGTPAMKLEVARVTMAETDARQRELNKAGAEAVRLAGIAADERNGVDVHSPEYLARQRRQAEKRHEIA